MRRMYGDYTVRYWNHDTLGQRVTIGRIGRTEKVEISREEWDDIQKDHDDVEFAARRFFQREYSSVVG